MIARDKHGSFGENVSSNSISILHIEDSDVDAYLIEEQFSRSHKNKYTIEHCGSLANATKRLKNETFDTIFLDLFLPDSSGIETLIQLREVTNSIPVIILTCNQDRKIIENLIIHGAQDYINKEEFNIKTIDRTIRYSIERKKTELELQTLAHHDSLTSLVNRTVFMKRLNTALENKKQKKSDQHIAVLLLDLDNFKTINDTYGHGVGDQLLIKASQRLTNCIRENDTASRLGGDEFTILFENIEHLNSISTIANKILTVLSKPYLIDDKTIITTSSIGVASTYDLKKLSPEDLLKNSDTAMYVAKNKGGNAVSFFTRELHVSSQIKSNLEGNLKKAITNNELEVYFQPQVNIKTGEISGAEALVRWNHEQYGLIPPVGFIPALEETGLILPATEYIMHQSLKVWEQWQKEGIINKEQKISINIPPQFISQPNALNKIIDISSQYKVKFNCIELELTENTFMDISPKNIDVLNNLIKNGFRLAIDDFGTGYSSLGYLKAFPINCLKLDRLFVKDILNSPKDEAIAEAMIRLCDKIDITLIAEGVDTKEKLNKLDELGCKIIQGYYFSHPLQRDHFKRFIKEFNP